MLKARVAVFVSGGGTNLQAMLDAGMPHAEIALVVTRKPGAYACARAELAGIPSLAIPERREAFEEKALAALRAHRIDIVVLAGFLTILSGEFVRQYEGRIVNIHPALIPAFCGKGMYGLKVHEAVLARGCKVTGATVHLVNEIPDGGPILSQKAVRVLPDDMPETLQRRVMEEAEWRILPPAVDRVCEEYLRNRRSIWPDTGGVKERCE